jgi:hypothetical protein
MELVGLVLNIVRIVCVRGTSDIVVDDIIQQLSFYLCYQNLLQLTVIQLARDIICVNQSKSITLTGLIWCYFSALE